MYLILAETVFAGGAVIPLKFAFLIPVKNYLWVTVNKKAVIINMLQPVNGIANRFRPVALLLALYLIVCFATRLALCARAASLPTVFTFIPAFFIGLLYDVATGLVIILPFVLHITFTGNRIYSRTGRWVTAAFFVVLLCLMLFTSLFPEYNRDLTTGVTIYIGFRFAVFLMLCFTSPAFRNKWRSGVLLVFLFITVFILLFNAVSEWFFWSEFSSRYNFIAVDYLVYTNEVAGNIRESYPLPAIITTIALGTIAIIVYMRKPVKRSVAQPVPFIKRLAVLAAAGALALAFVYLLSPDWKQYSKNNFANEVAGNGIYDFAQAFKNNDLDFYKYYKTIPDTTAFAKVRQQLQTPFSRFTGDSTNSITREVHYPGAEQQLNVVLISVESLSASYMKAFGNTDNITPELDSLAAYSMFFNQMYASGTRTVRGLEALSLSIPPLPGESIIKRPGNEHLFSLGSVFKNKGYTTQFIYGGYSYFDNMKYFFGNNGYDVIDRTAIDKKDMHYANIWGVADEDLFTLALKTFDSNYLKGKPFFSHIMTVSNHRPYTYPEGRIDIPSGTGRHGAVKYTDYAIGRFIKEASQKPWFGKTIFIIVADHCASSAGKVALPLPGYHIPLIIYAPGIIKPQQVNTLTAQIDIAPTLLGLLNLNYTSKFFGQDVFNTPEDKRRAFISTYQGLGYVHGNDLIIQSPVKKVKQYQADFKTDNAVEKPLQPAAVNEAIAFYQTIAWLMKHGRYTATDSVR